MKKIKSVKHLQADKKRIRQRREELENKIRRDWQNLKESARPANLAKETINECLRNKAEKNMNDESILKSAFTYGVTLFAKKFMDKAGEKFDSFFRK